MFELVHQLSKGGVELANVPVVLADSLVIQVLIRLHVFLGRLDRQVGLVRPNRQEKWSLFILPRLQPIDGLLDADHGAGPIGPPQGFTIADIIGRVQVMR